MKRIVWPLISLFCLSLLVVTVTTMPQKEANKHTGVIASPVSLTQASAKEKTAKRTLDTLLAQRYQITEYTILDSGVNTSSAGDNCYWFRCEVSQKPVSGQGIPHTPNALSDMPGVILEGDSTPKALPRAELPKDESVLKAEPSPKEQGRTPKESTAADLTEESTYYVYQDRLYLENPLENSKKVP